MNRSIILASASPRRKEILELIGFEPDIRPDDSPEISSSAEPSGMVKELSAHKAGNIAKNVRDGLVLGADTVVALDGLILGKPGNAEKAYEMLRALSGRVHSVFTGVTLILMKDGKEAARSCFFEETHVSVVPLSDEEIREYIRTGEPFDKAGGYGIQGVFAKYIDRIEGDYLNVVGLPAAAVYRHIKNLNLSIRISETH